MIGVVALSELKCSFLAPSSLNLYGPTLGTFGVPVNMLPRVKHQIEQLRSNRLAQVTDELTVGCEFEVFSISQLVMTVLRSKLVSGLSNCFHGGR
ncbi:MAG: hypothetical protein B7Y45_07475 [Sphingomonas sp. 28-66-16]|nr:MAG: hypothetical protein B7Y45_07475 [Sphingomonas sp. 28-66-16]